MLGRAGGRRVGAGVVDDDDLAARQMRAQLLERGRDPELLAKGGDHYRKIVEAR